MRFAIVSDDEKVVHASWDSGDEMRPVLTEAIMGNEFVLGLRPGRRKQIEEAVDDALNRMFHARGLAAPRL